MNFVAILLIALSMSMDAFAVCLAAGTQEGNSRPRPIFRLAFHFGLFQFLMPIIGWYAGTSVLRYFSSFDDWVAFALLAIVGIRMVRSGFDQNGTDPKTNPSRGWTLVMLALATSMDALAIGFSLGMVGVRIWYPAVVIGLVTGLISWLGILLGNRLGAKFGNRMEIIGGSMLILIGIWIVLPHFFA